MQNSNELTAQQYRKYNGQSVLSALRSIGREATADELTDFIGNAIGQPADMLKAEVRQVLRRGILNGFLVRNGRDYSLSGGDTFVDIDGPKKRRTISFNKAYATNKTNSKKQMASSKKQMASSKKQMSNSEKNLSAPPKRLISAPAAAQSASTKMEEYDSDSSADDPEVEYDEETLGSSSSEEEPEQQFISFFRQRQ